MIRSIASPSRSRDDALVSVVLPLYNEAAVLPRLTRLVEDALQSCCRRYEIIYVNDGSHDESRAVLDELAYENPRIRAVHFSRNFGHQAAVQAGLMYAEGQAIVVMDSDLQDDPAAIPRFLERWREGYDVVYAVRMNRKESAVKRALFYGFYRVLNAVSDIPIPNDAGNFGLIDRRVAEQIVRVIDRDRFFPGLRRWVGFRQIGVPVERLARHDDQPRVSLRQLGRLAKSAIFSFSSFPLSLFYAIAAVSMLVCAALCGFTLYHRLFTGLAAPGWTSITITASFFGAINSLGLGVLGEYVVRIYDQVRARPLFIVEQEVNFSRGEPETLGVAREGRYSSLLDQ